jgi:hypothetical protein
VKLRYERPGNAIDENEFIAIVISVAPQTYQGVLTSEQMRQGDSLRLNHLAVVMDMQWRAMGGAKDNDDEGEIALITFSGMLQLQPKWASSIRMPAEEETRK